MLESCAPAWTASDPQQFTVCPVQDLQDQRAMLQAAASAMQQHKTRAAFASWLDFIDARAKAREKALSALNWFTQRSAMQAMASWKVCSRPVALHAHCYYSSAVRFCHRCLLCSAWVFHASFTNCTVLQGYVAAQRQQQALAELAHAHWCSGYQAKALAAWRQGIQIQQSQHASLHAIASRWSNRLAAECFDAWRGNAEHNRELRERLSFAMGTCLCEGD